MKGNAAGMVILPWLVSLGAGYVESRWGIRVPAEVQVAVATTILGVANMGLRMITRQSLLARGGGEAAILGK
jgi:hypothetical protein